MSETEVLVDRDHLMRQTQGDHDLMVEILQIFADQMELRLENLVAEAPDLHEQAHSIKGSARGIGAWGLAEAAERVELAKGNPSSHLHELRMAILAARHEVRLMLRSKDI